MSRITVSFTKLVENSNAQFSISASLPIYFNTSKKILGDVIGELDFYDMSKKSKTDIEIDYSFMESIISPFTLWEIVASDARHNKNWDFESLQKYTFTVLKEIYNHFVEQRIELVIMDDKSCIPSYSIWLVCKKLQIPVLVLGSARTHERVWFSNDTFENNLEFTSKFKTNLASSKLIFDNDVKNYLSNIASYKSQSFKGKVRFNSKIEGAIFKLVSLASLWLYNFKFPKNRVTYNSIFSQFWISSLKNFNKFVHQKFLNKELPTEKFFLFTLHVQPEASTDVLAPYFVEQISVIRQIALSLPPNYRLVVKEHVPAFGSRSSNFYKTIQSIPNVWLLSPEFSNQELLKVCSGVVTITGTIGWEAWCVGKPVAVFGNTRYDSLPGVYKVSNAEQLKNWVRGVVLNQVTIQSPHEIYCAVRTLLDTTCSGFLDHLKHNKRTLTNENVHSIAEGVYARYLWLLKTSKIKTNKILGEPN